MIFKKDLNFHLLLFFFCSLCLFNILMTYSTTYYFSSNFYFKQALYLFLGIFVSSLFFFFIYKDDIYEKQVLRFNFLNISFVILAIFLTLLLFVLPESLLPTIKGAKRWIKTPLFNIAPVEILKISFVYIFAIIFSSDKFIKNKNNIKLTFFIPIAILFLFLLVTVTIKQKDFGNFFLFCSVFVTMTFVFFDKIRLFFKIIFVGLLALAGLIVIAPHRINRIISWLNSESQNSNYQVLQGLNTISEGSFFGQGIGDSIMKLGYIPEVHTDMVFATLLSEFGIIGFLFYIFFIFGFFFVLIRKAFHFDNLFLLNFSLISFFLIIYQIFTNLFGVLGVIPLKGINVPFLSYGGSAGISITILFFMNIIAYSIYYNHINKNKKGLEIEKNIS